MQEGSVSLFFGSYGLLFYFYDSGFPACPFSRVFRFACFFGSSGLPVFSGFRLACFLWFPACLLFRVFRLACFFGSSGLPVFPGFRLACFLWFPACLFFLVSGLPVFSGFSVFFRSFQPFLGLLGFFLFCIADFSVFLFCICKVAVLFCPFGRKYTNPVPESQVVDYQIQLFR